MLGVCASMPRCLHVVPTGSPLISPRPQLDRRCLMAADAPASRNEGFCLSPGAAAHGITGGAKSIMWQVPRESCKMVGNASLWFTCCLFLPTLPASQWGMRRQKCQENFSVSWWGGWSFHCHLAFHEKQLLCEKGSVCAVISSGSFAVAVLSSCHRMITNGLFF